MTREVYRTIVADPPWEMPGGGPRKPGGGRLPYPTMTLEEIRALDVPADLRSTLFLWTTEAFLIDGSALSVVHAWGFSRTRILIWAKNVIGLGDFPRRNHEVCLVAIRGQRRDVRSVQNWNCVYEGARRHSAKPDGFFDLVESVSPGPYLEMFARRQRLGWHTWGNEALEHVEIEERPYHPDQDAHLFVEGEAA